MSGSLDITPKFHFRWIVRDFQKQFDFIHTHVWECMHNMACIGYDVRAAKNDSKRPQKHHHIPLTSYGIAFLLRHSPAVEKALSCCVEFNVSSLLLMVFILRIDELIGTVIEIVKADVEERCTIEGPSTTCNKNKAHGERQVLRNSTPKIEPWKGFHFVTSCEVCKPFTRLEIG